MIDSLLKNIHRTLLIIAPLLLVACTSSPISMQLQPELTVTQTSEPLISKSSWAINSQDHRIEKYLIEVSKGEKAATLINESQSSRLIIETALQQQWHKKGLRFNAESSNKINIELIKLLAKVEQKTLTHNIATKIVIKVELSSRAQTFSKIFTLQSTKKGVFTANTQKLGEQLNTQLAQVLNEIIKDPQLHVKLQQL